MAVCDVPSLITPLGVYRIHPSGTMGAWGPQEVVGELRLALLIYPVSNPHRKPWLKFLDLLTCLIWGDVNL